MKIIFLPVFFIFFLSLYSCTKELDQGNTYVDPNPNDIEVRMRNQTNYVLNDLRLSNFVNEANYSILQPLASSTFQSLPFLSSYVKLSFDVDGHAFEYAPTSQQNSERLSTNVRYQLSIQSLDTLSRTFAFKLESLDN